MPAFCLLACFVTRASAADWPARVFAPYMYVGADDNFQLAQCDQACGQKYYTLAFIIADPHANPAWDGRFPVEKNFFASQIAAIRRLGGDVIVSFGGEGGTELALADHDAISLQAKYQAVIDRYKLSWLDFDIEGDALSNQEANAHRNTALAALQKTNPRLIISYTLPVDPSGLSGDSQKLLTDAKARGLNVSSVNIMTMYFGVEFFSKGKTMSDLSIASALKAHDQCAQIDPAITLGLTPCIGQNGDSSQIFSEEDARALEKWASGQPWVSSLSFWCSNRDAGRPNEGNDSTFSGVAQKPWAFTLIFQPFTAR